MPDTAFIGEIYMSGFNFAPRNFAFCNGQLLSIATNTALFSLLGTTYGGDGRVTFALPNLQGRVPMGQGFGAGLTPRTLGEINGVENVTLISAEMPAHTHTVIAASEAGDASTPSGNYFANTGALDKEYKGTTAAPVTMNPQMIGLSGGNQPHQNMQPYIVLNFYICLYGIFPSRN